MKINKLKRKDINIMILVYILGSCFLIISPDIFNFNNYERMVIYILVIGVPVLMISLIYILLKITKGCF